MTRTPLFAAAVLAAAAIAGLRVTTAATDATATLAVAGRANATPSIAADAGRVVVAWSATAGGATDIYVASSTDGGRTFAAPVRVNDVAGNANVSGEQPPRVVLIPPHAGADLQVRPSIVVVWTAKAPSGTRVVSARSDDAGKSFGKARAIAGGEAAGNRGWESAAVAADGRVLSVWLDHRELASAPGSGAAMAHDHLHMQKADGVAKAQLSKLYFSDGVSGARALAAGVCYCCKTSLAAAADGAVYAVWRHVYPGNVRDIAFTRSRDGGKTFAEPTRVSEDRWAIDGCPENGPAVATAGNQVVVVWPTLVPGAGGAEPAMQLFHASTTDGSRFTPRAPLPTEGVPRHPQVVALADGSLVAAWDEAVSGRRRVVLTSRGPSSPAFAGRRVVADADSAEYPAVAAVGGTAVVAWKSGNAERSVIHVARVVR
jgi:hypothetical protein